MTKNSVIEAVEATKLALEANSDSKWIVGFSGGKDSSAMLKIIIAAAKKATPCPKNISVIYCDTGVENPVLDRYVKSLFSDLDSEFSDSGLPFETHLLKAPVADRFFVKVIGRGYPTPTNMFRWCTDRLRVNPVASFIKSSSADDAIVCLGLRKFESQQRDRTLEKHGNEAWQNKTGKGHSYRMFLPILELSIPDVWDVIFMKGQPQSLKPLILEKIYRGASGECPIVKSPMAAPCGSGRFGCWTCTVVRKDKSMIALIDDGHKDLEPYLKFRNWLAVIRDEPERRWKKRRNGVAGMGPLTLKTRKEILTKLDALAQQVGEELISPEERNVIQELWLLDRDTEEA